MGILIVAYLFGGKTVFGYIIGLNMIGLHITVHSILLYHTTRNARALNQAI